VAKVAFAVPGDLSAATGGYAYAREIIAGLAVQDIDVAHIALPAGFPRPSANDLAETERLLAHVLNGTPLLIDGLAFGAFPADLAAALPQPLIALVHHPLALESGLSVEDAQHFRETERLALAAADRVIAASPTTAAELTNAYDVSADRITVAEPGTHPRQRSLGSGSETVQLLSVGAISERKGFDVLVTALAASPKRNWHLTIAGDTERNADTTAAIASKITAHDLDINVTMTGRVSDEELAALYRSSDVFVLASRYEGYGMVLAEAIANGLPIVTTTGGAAAETVPDAAAIKVPPNAVEPLRDAILRLVESSNERQARADASWNFAGELPTWKQTCARIASVIKEVSL